VGADLAIVITARSLSSNAIRMIGVVDESFDPKDPVDGASYFPITTFAHITQEPGDYALSLECSTEVPNAAACSGRCLTAARKRNPTPSTLGDC